MKTLPILLFCLLFAGRLAAQGIVLDDDGYRQTPYRPATRSSEFGSAKSLLTPGVFALNQGHNPACGGFSIAAAAGMRFMFYCNGRYSTQHPMPEFSAMYLCCKANPGMPPRGYSMQNLLDVFVENGIPLAKTYPNDPLGCPFAITPEVDSAAALFRLWKYARIFDLPSDVCPNADEACLTRHRETIYQNTVAALDAPLPVIVVLAVPPAFANLKSSDCSLTALPSPGETPLYHAVVVTGYDDKRGAFQILNSYGKDWGCNGTAWIGYELFKRSARYGYVLEWNWDEIEEVPCEMVWRR